MLRFNAEKFNPLIGLLFLLFAVGTATAIWVFFRDKRILWEAPGLSLALFLFIFASFAGWRVEITPDEITIVKFFWSRKRVRRADITGWATKSGWKGGDRIDRVPYRRLEIYTNKKSPPFMIPTSALKKGDIQKIIELLPSKTER